MNHNKSHNKYDVILRDSKAFAICPFTISIYNLKIFLLNIDQEYRNTIIIMTNMLNETL